jgi:type I restriction enzyme R subunit
MPLDSMTAVRELFHICFWLARTCGKGAKPMDGLTFDPTLLPKSSPVPPQTLAQLQLLEAQLAEKGSRLTELLTGKAALDAELERLTAYVIAGCTVAFFSFSLFGVFSSVSGLLLGFSKCTEAHSMSRC